MVAIIAFKMYIFLQYALKICEKIGFYIIKHNTITILLIFHDNYFIIRNAFISLKIDFKNIWVQLILTKVQLFVYKLV